MKHTLIIIAAFSLLSCGGSKSGMIEFSVPDRLSGQTDVLELSCDPIDTVDIAVIGTQISGIEEVRRLSDIEGIRIKAIFDDVKENLAPAQEILKENGQLAADEYSGDGRWRDICEREDLDLIYICSPEKVRTTIAVYAMECGKHVACESPAALTLNDCWELVNTAEKTRRHCTMIQEGNYDPFELTTLNMAEMGFFGDIKHIESGSLNSADAIGPAAQVLNIHRGDRLSYLLSVSGTENSLIKTELGKVIIIRNDSISSLPAGRKYSISGTVASAKKNRHQSISLDSCGRFWLSAKSGDSLLRSYTHPIVKEIKDLDLAADYRIVYCLRNGLPLDTDVYDVAEWSAVAPLSAISARHNGKAVMFPDFTRHSWNKVKGYKQYKNDK